MNSLPRWHADFDSRAESEAAARDSAALVVKVLSTSWTEFPHTDPPTLDVELSGGSCLSIGWDFTYSHRLLRLFEGERETGRACTGEETGLPAAVLERLVDDVREAALQWDAERLADSMDDGQEGAGRER